ncbi:unnamed protein product, partial [Prorocentrum cordatum]
PSRLPTRTRTLKPGRASRRSYARPRSREGSGARSTRPPRWARRFAGRRKEGGRGGKGGGRREVEDQEAALDAVASAIKIPGRGPSAPAPLYTQDSGYKNIHGRCKRVDSTCCPPLGKRDQRQ